MAKKILIVQVVLLAAALIALLAKELPGALREWKILQMAKKS